MYNIANKNCNNICKDRDEELRDFQRWKYLTLQKALNLCKIINTKMLNDNPQLIQAIIYTPKCLVRYTKYICGCQLHCYNKLLSDFTYDKKCVLFDLKDLYSDSNYIDCNFLDRRVINKRFVGRSADYDIFKIRENIYNEVNKTLSGNLNKEALICSAYEIRDACKNNQECVKFFLTKKPICNCKNVRLPSNLNMIENILFHPQDSNIIVRTKRSTNEPEIKLPIFISEDLGIINNDLNLTDQTYSNSAKGNSVQFLVILLLMAASFSSKINSCALFRLFVVLAGSSILLLTYF